MTSTMAETETRGLNQDAETFVGSWGLVSFEHTLPSGKVSTPFGNSPSGLILYQASGHMSAQLSVASPHRLAHDDPQDASVAEASEAWRNYVGYWGTFTVDSERCIVTHRVEGSSLPNWVGTDQLRHFRFEGPDYLILEARLPSGRSTLTWQRRPL